MFSTSSALRKDVVFYDGKASHTFSLHLISHEQMQRSDSRAISTAICPLSPLPFFHTLLSSAVPAITHGERGRERERGGQSGEQAASLSPDPRALGWGVEMGNVASCMHGMRSSQTRWLTGEEGLSAVAFGQLPLCYTGLPPSWLFISSQ